MDQSSPTQSQSQGAYPPKRRTNPLLLFMVAFIVAAVIGVILYFVQIRRPLAAVLLDHLRDTCRTCPLGEIERRAPVAGQHVRVGASL